MLTAKLPPNEAERLKALMELEIMDSDPEKEFDDIVQLASQICETPISVISLLDDRRQWFKAKVGLEVNETNRTVAFCSHAILDDHLMEVENALNDERFHDNPLVVNAPDIRFYAGYPIIMANGTKLGTLCVIDRVPRHLTPIQANAIEVLSKQVTKQLELRISKRKMEFQAQELKKLNESNAKLLSVIAHDLRSPLASLWQIIDLLNSCDLSPDEALELIKESGHYVENSLGLLDGMVSWAKQQFQGKDILIREVSVENVLKEIVEMNSLQTKAKGNAVNVISDIGTLKLNENVLRLLSRNLLINANKFTEHGEITIKTLVVDGFLKVQVSDTGIGMEQAQIDKLFNWKKENSTSGTSGEKGLGIGLRLCKEMVDVEGGNLWVESKPGYGTKFGFSIPIR
jgi:signal transduction histidine kinase